MTADYVHADPLYELTRRQTTEPNPTARARRPGACCATSSTTGDAPSDQLYKWADRFKEEPERRIEVLQVLAKRQTAQKDLANLAVVRQNIGAELMALSHRARDRKDLDAAVRADQVMRNAEEADKYFDLALQSLSREGPQRSGNDHQRPARAAHGRAAHQQAV